MSNKGAIPEGDKEVFTLKFREDGDIDLQDVSRFFYYVKIAYSYIEQNPEIIDQIPDRVEHADDYPMYWPIDPNLDETRPHNAYITEYHQRLTEELKHEFSQEKRGQNRRNELLLMDSDISVRNFNRGSLEIVFAIAMTTFAFERLMRIVFALVVLVSGGEFETKRIGYRVKIDKSLDEVIEILKEIFR